MDILGIGNILLDIFCFSDEECALPLGLHPNSTSHVTPERLNEMLLGVQNPLYIAGGSVPNSLKAAGMLGMDCQCIGCTGMDEAEDDQWARIIRQDLSSTGIALSFEKRNRPTGRCLVLYMPGQMKTIACAPGCAPTLRPEQIQPETVSRARVVHIDGHLLRNKDVIDKTVNICRACSIPVSIDLCAPSIAHCHASEIMEIIRHQRCIIFANTDESRALAVRLAELLPAPAKQQGTDPEELVYAWLAVHSETAPVFVRKQGPEGATVWSGSQRITTQGEPVSDPLDDTAAGDIFAGVWLSGFLDGKTERECIENADRAARATLSVPGSRIESELLRNANHT